MMKLLEKVEKKKKLKVEAKVDRKKEEVKKKVKIEIISIDIIKNTLILEVDQKINIKKIKDDLILFLKISK